MVKMLVNNILRAIFTAMYHFWLRTAQDRSTRLTKYQSSLLVLTSISSLYTQIIDKVDAPIIAVSNYLHSSLSILPDVVRAHTSLDDLQSSASRFAF